MWLLPYRFRLAGLILLSGGILLSVARFSFGFNPTLLETKVFAVYSAYFETRFFSVISNNILEEFCGLLLLSGLFFLGFSKEKTGPDDLWELRTRALVWAVYIDTALLLFSFIFIFGVAFLKMMTLNLFLVLAIYDILFFTFRSLHRRRQKIPPGV